MTIKLLCLFLFFSIGDFHQGQGTQYIDNNNIATLEEVYELDDLDDEVEEEFDTVNDETGCRNMSCEVGISFYNVVHIMNNGNENKRSLSLKNLKDTNKENKRKVMSDSHAHRHVERHPDHLARKKRFSGNYEKLSSFEQAHEDGLHFNERSESSISDMELYQEKFRRFINGRNDVHEMQKKSYGQDEHLLQKLFKRNAGHEHYDAHHSAIRRNIKNTSVHQENVIDEEPTFESDTIHHVDSVGTLFFVD
uniref:Seminal fluid protein n=1 Tax=Heterorhabditis bacteriophora TaxID=37862 RepID=A0A1I7WUZ4_HETBA